jgi:hypothetical protein
MKYSEKIQIMFVLNLLLPGFLGTLVAENLIQTKPYGMIVGVVLLFIYIRIAANDENKAKSLYCGSIFMLCSQIIPILQLLVGMTGIWIVGLLNDFKNENERYTGYHWDLIGNIQLFILTIFCGIVFIVISRFIGDGFVNKKATNQSVK